MSESYERGLELEKLVTKLFQSKGYDAKHNIKLTGKSGVEHQIDVYAEFRAPLHISKVVIECKSYDKPVDKDIVMKLIHEVDDLGVDRGILITTSYFTPDAVSIAEGYNIDLWDGSKLRELLGDAVVEEIATPMNIYHIKPIISAEDSVKVVDDSLKGLFGKKGRIEAHSSIFVPFYEVDVEARIQEVKGVFKKRVEERIVNTRILVDAITGTLCTYLSRSGVAPVYILPKLSDEERRAFKILMTSGSVTVSAIASLMSCSTAKARKILQGLVAKGVTEMRRYRRSIFYQLRTEIPDPSSLQCVSSILKMEMGKPHEDIVIEPTLSLTSVEELVQLFWEGHVKGYRTVYYPYHACKIAEDEKRYIKAIDMMTGRIDERKGRLFTLIYPDLPF